MKAVSGMPEAALVMFAAPSRSSRARSPKTIWGSLTFALSEVDGLFLWLAQKNGASTLLNTNGA